MNCDLVESLPCVYERFVQICSNQRLCLQKLMKLTSAYIKKIYICPTHQVGLSYSSPSISNLLSDIIQCLKRDKNCNGRVVQMPQLWKVWGVGLGGGEGSMINSSADANSWGWGS